MRMAKQSSSDLMELLDLIVGFPAQFTNHDEKEPLPMMVEARMKLIHALERLQNRFDIFPFSNEDFAAAVQCHAHGRCLQALHFRFTSYYEFCSK
jgi:hypothetical protein